MYRKKLFSSLFLITLIFIGCGSDNSSKDNSIVASNIFIPSSDNNNSPNDSQTNINNERIIEVDNQEKNSSIEENPVNSGSVVYNNTPSSTTNSSSKVSGRVIDGELIYATVFLDLNRNRLLDENEPKAKTDENGDYNLVISSEAKSHANYINKTAPLVSIGGFDKKSKKEFVGTFTAPFSEANPNITPITTLMNEMLEENTTQTLDDVKSKLANSLNISAEDLMKDPVELAKAGDATLLELSLKVHQSSEILSKSLVDKKESIEVYALIAKELNRNETSLDVALENTVDSNNDSFDTNFIATSKVAVRELNRNIRGLFENHKDDFGTDTTIVAKIALTLNKTQNQIIDAVNKNEVTSIEGVNWEDNVIDDVSKEIVRQLLLIVGYQNEDDIADIAKFNSIDDDLTLESLKVLLEADGNYAHIIDIIEEKLKDLKEDKGENSESVQITESVENLSIKQMRNADWNSGFCEEIEVKNISNSSLKWQVKVSVNGIINNLWSANYTQDSDTHELTASGVSWNSILNPNQSTIFGYCATKTAESSLGEDSSSDSSRLVVTQSRESDWNSGFCEKIKVTNSEDKKILNWEVSFDVEGIINNLWSANYSQDENLKVIASGLDWNRDVPANGSVEFGYCASKVATPTDPDEIAVKNDVEALTFDNIKLDNTQEDEIVGVLNLITIGENGSTITWESDSSAISSVGEVTRPAIGQDNIEVELLAVIKKGNYRKTKRFNLTVLAFEKSDRDSVDEAKDALTFDEIRLLNLSEDKISSNLNLITQGKLNTIISWVSNSSAITVNGLVIRPIYGESNQSVSLTATVKKGDIEESKIFNLTVLAEEKENPISPLTSKYQEVLGLSLKFYEAQRATGPFPTVDWRKAGGLDDGSDVGRDLTGGWFDAGDHVKFNLPMSYSATMLNWGMLSFANGYNETGKLEYGKEQVKYALDYFIQAYNEGANPDSASDDEVYYQVGDGGADHSFWGPPELMTMDRPTFTCNSENKCSEVAGGMAAAMASGAILFSDDTVYSATLLDKAKKIYRYAEEYQGNNGYTAADGYYRSYSGYSDELAWGAVWLYKATGDINYLNKAKEYVADASDALYWSQSWDNVSNGVNLLLSQITGDDSYTNAIETHLNHWLNDVTKTSGGLRFLNQWGSLRYSSTASFMALLYAQGLDEGDKKSDYLAFAKEQIDYILGDNPRNSSYVVGYGTNPPINPHHRAAHNSQTNNIDSPTDNEFILEGALVGGPKSADDFDYADDRRDYMANEVATDYNAGFVGALAGLVDLSDDNSSTVSPTVESIFSEFNIGFGGSSSFPFTSTTDGETIWVNSTDLALDDNIENSSNYSSIKNFDASAFDSLQKSLKSSKFLVYWFVDGWQENWFDIDKIQQAMDSGIVPVFNYWYFGDNLMNDMPDDAKKSEYAEDYAKVATLLNKLNGKKILIMEPEFNKNNILSTEDNQREFASIISNAIDYIKANTTDVLFSLAMTDTGSRGVNQTYEKCGYTNCALGDKYEWGRPEIIYSELGDKLDFISFQQMIGQFSRDPSDAGDWDNPNPKAYSDDEIGIDLLADRINNFTEFLKEKYNKPVFLPYIAIATATWSDDNSNGAIEVSEIDESGWESKANDTYKKLSEIKSTLQSNGLFGFAPMALFDNPRHDYGGYQFFMNNEYHLGLISSGAIDETDSASHGDLKFKMNTISYIFGGTIVPQKTDQEIVTEDKADLLFENIRNLNREEDNISTNMTLPINGANGSTIGWSSSNSKFISDIGVVTSPTLDEGDQVVILTATITYGEVSEIKEFRLTVVAKEPTTTSQSKYHDVLGLSLKFYEAQRDVGPFPTVDWRKPASINDGSDVGVDLNGGWFDAGDHVKFNLPMSYSVSMLNWSMISTPQAYTQAGKLDYGKEQVKYALDYLLNAYQAGSDLDSPADDKVYFQVADGYADHNFWGPPEELNMDRPTFTCDSDGGCAAVSGTMVASFASGAILFADDTAYSQRLLDSAKRLHKFAMTYPTDNDYSSVGQDFYKLYDSSNEDQIAWGAIWLYRATHDVQYLNDAESLVEGKYPWAQSWDNMFLGVFELLAEETNDSSYKDRVKNELNAWINKDVPTTQGGLRVRLEWGSLRYATAVSFISLMYSDLLDSDTEKEPYINFAKSQIDYALGDNPQNFSYVVGYGDNYPTHPHHRGASGTTKEDPNPNKYLIEGALVGGPMSADDSDYEDIRDGEVAWKCNEVTTDYNAGFTGALAKLALLYGE